MKPHRFFIGLLVFAALVAWVHLKSGSAPSGTARAAALDQRLNFNQGIGFYVYSGGQLGWLDYPATAERDKIQEQSIPVSGSDFHLFAYGIDFSKTPSGLPPHLLEFAVVLFNTQYNIDNPDFQRRELGDRQGPYAVHFIPLAGYDQPAYEITCDLWDALKKKSSAPPIWGLKVRDGIAGGAPFIFWFTFKEAAGA